MPSGRYRGWDIYYKRENCADDMNRRPRIDRVPVACHHWCMDIPTESVQDIALWLHANAARARLGAAAPFIGGIAFGKPPIRRIASLDQLETDRQTWRWWLERAGSEREFCDALRARVGIELESASAKADDPMRSRRSKGSRHPV